MSSTFFIYSLIFLLISTPIILVSTKCTCDAADATEEAQHDKTRVLHLKIEAFIAILILGGIGICIPQLGKKYECLQADKSLFFLIKAFAGGVILATGFIHVLSDAFENLTSPCLKESPWGLFQFTGFFAMLAAILSLMVDSFSISFLESRQCVEDEEKSGGAVADVSNSELIKHKVNAHVLELGIIVHSVIIGILLGASSDAVRGGRIEKGLEGNEGGEE